MRPASVSQGCVDVMRCPFCRFPDSKVIDSREVEDGQAIRRRRSCPECSRRFTTVEESVLAVVKRSGVTEPFSRAKVIVGVRRACQGRPVDEDALALLSQQVEEAIRATGCAEISSHEVGLEILGPLRNLDEVAYLRFASVYRSFDSVDDFENEIERLRQEREQRENAAATADSESASGSDSDKSPVEAVAATAEPGAVPDSDPKPFGGQIGKATQSGSILASASTVGSAPRS